MPKGVYERKAKKSTAKKSAKKVTTGKSKAPKVRRTK